MRLANGNRSNIQNICWGAKRSDCVADEKRWEISEGTSIRRDEKIERKFCFWLLDANSHTHTLDAYRAVGGHSCWVFDRLEASVICWPRCIKGFLWYSDIRRPFWSALAQFLLILGPFGRLRGIPDFMIQLDSDVILEWFGSISANSCTVWRFASDLSSAVSKNFCDTARFGSYFEVLRLNWYWFSDRLEVSSWSYCRCIKEILWYSEIRLAFPLSLALNAVGWGGMR